MDFKYLREYYTYTPPLNMTSYDEEQKSTLDRLLGQCFQLTNFQSLMLERSFFKNGSVYKITEQDSLYFLVDNFERLIAKRHPMRGNFELDPADDNKLHEMMEHGIGFQCIGLTLDHLYDELRTYNGASKFFSREGTVSANSIYSYIYGKII
ncbi:MULTISPECIES: hypothetical protein [Pelosinus]|uniref:hypothetical protein n=2 Tax=Sporomusaceae TaxID=1843490 RepID=UPI00037DBE62|nr:MULTISPECIES: hypothetical protein [Pelosinus]